MIRGKCLSKQPIFIKDMTISTLLSSREEGMGEESTHRCTIKASTVHAWLCASHKPHARCCRWHTGRIKKGEQGREVARREKGKFSGTFVTEYWPNHIHIPINIPTCLLGAGGELTPISQRTVALTWQGMAGQTNDSDDTQQTKRWPRSNRD